MTTKKWRPCMHQDSLQMPRFDRVNIHPKRLVGLGCRDRLHIVMAPRANYLCASLEIFYFVSLLSWAHIWKISRKTCRVRVVESLCFMCVSLSITLIHHHPSSNLLPLSVQITQVTTSKLDFEGSLVSPKHGVVLIKR